MLVILDRAFPPGIWAILHSFFGSHPLTDHMSVQLKKLREGSRLYSILRMKCPRCHRGNLFTTSNPWNLKKMLQMPARCTICRQDFEIEPGFYSGALWTSYPIVVFTDLLILSTILIYPRYIGLICAIMITVSLLLQPIVMRLGRAIWINIFVRYDATIAKACAGQRDPTTPES